MQPVEGGVARLDTQTGDVSLCRIGAAGMTCEASIEDRERLEARIRELSEGPATLDGNAPPATAPGASSQLPDDVEIDRAIGRMKKLFEAFRDIAREFDRSPAPENGPAPDRT